MAVEFSSVRKELHTRVQKILFQDGSGGKDMATYIKDTLVRKELKFKVQNVIYQSLLQDNNRGLDLKPAVIESIRAMVEEWKEKTSDAVETLLRKSGTGLTTQRQAAHRQVLEDRWEELGTLSTAPGPNKVAEKADPLYGPDDMYALITGSLNRVSSGRTSTAGGNNTTSSNTNTSRSSNSRSSSNTTTSAKNTTTTTTSSSSSSAWAAGGLSLGSFCLDVPCPSREQLCAALQELHPSAPQADLEVNARCKVLDPVSSWGEECAARVIDSGLYPLARQVCKTGCPHGQRFALWCMALGIEVSSCEEYRGFFSGLRERVLRSGCPLDNVLLSDVALCISDSDCYFVFEDIAYQIVLAFLRDPDTGVFSEKEKDEEEKDEKKDMAALEGGSTKSGGVAAGGQQRLRGDACPFVPCHGFSCFVAPLCYLHKDVHMVYVLFKALYSRYFGPLLSLSDHPSSILYLCVVFERLFEDRSPLLVLHFSRLGIDPVKLVFKWLLYGFAGYLETDQLLYLWDRVVGFDSLVFFPLLAAAILEYRTPCLTLATCSEQAEKMLADLHHISILPLLQAQLFL